MESGSDQQYKFTQEFEKRKGYVPVKALFAQEKALVQPHLVLVDIAVLKHEGTFPPEFATAEADIFKTEDLVFEEDASRENIIKNFKRTDIKKLDGMIDTHIANDTSLLTKLKIDDLSNMDPAQAVTLATEIVTKSMKYAYQLVPQYKGKLSEHWKQKVEQMTKEGTYKSFIEEQNSEYDSLSPDQLLERGEGVCRHYALATMAVYERLKARDTQGKLRDTYLPYSSNIFDPQDIEDHAFNILIAHRTGFDTVVTVVDPTWYLNSVFPNNKEDFTITRVVSALQVISQGGIREKLGISTQEINEIADTQLLRMEQDSEVDTYLSLIDFKNTLNDVEFRIRPKEFAKGVQKLLDLAKDKKPYKIWQRISSIFASRKLSGLSGLSIDSIGSAVDFSLQMNQKPPEEERYFIRDRLARYREEYSTFKQTAKVQGVLRKIDELDKKLNT